MVPRGWTPGMAGRLMPTYNQWKRDNWERAHREQDISALTGTALGGHLATLHAAEYLQPESAVLCIGVGTGVWVREAINLAADVWAMDCAEAAFKTLPELTPFVTSPAALPWDKFDLALSLWVAPHMTDLDLQDQLAGVVRALKPSGVLAIHYKEPLNDGDAVDNREGAEDEFRRAASAGILRRRRHFAELVRRAGGRITKIVDENRSQFYQIREIAAHIVKGTAP